MDGDSPFRYNAFGRIIAVNSILPGFATDVSGSAPDITLLLDDKKPDLAQFDYVVELNYAKANSSETPFPSSNNNERSDRSFCFLISYWNGIEFVINAAGTKVWAKKPEEVKLDLVVAFFAGPILGFMLRLQGTLCLHASVIEIGDHCIGLVAPSGGGKSTTAAALALKGFSILSDDILVLDTRLGCPFAQPGYQGIRLTSDTVKKLFTDNKATPHLKPHGDKSLLDLPRSGYQHTSEANPLVAIYTRGSDTNSPDAMIRRVPGAGALKTLLHYTYPSRYYHLPAALRANELSQLSLLIQQVPLYEIHYQRSMETLPDLCDAIAENTRFQIEATAQVNTATNRRPVYE